MKKLIKIGLTGSIGMGKSTAAETLRRMGFPIYSADEAVHALLKKGGAGVRPVGRLFPKSLKRGAIDRALLGQFVFHDPNNLKKLELIIHPLIRHAERTFLQKARQARHRAVILEIPLLYETGAEKRCDVVLCVTAPKKVQRERVLARPGMTEQKLRAILKRQLPDREKRRRADYSVETGKGVEVTEKRLRRILKEQGVLP